MMDYILREEHSDSAVHYHKNCISTYTSKSHLKRLHVTKVHCVSPKQKRQCRSDLRHFDFKTQCLFCGNIICKPDTKHPHRNIRVVLCKTADSPNHKNFKTVIMDTCRARRDQWANEILVRVQGAVSDLHAADARYHYDCRTKFMAPKSVHLAASTAVGHASAQSDPAFDKLVRDMSAERSTIRNSSDIYKQYQLYGGMSMTKRTLIAALKAHFEDDLVIFRSAGIASILVFREKAAAIFSLIPDDNDDDLEQAMKMVVKQVNRETNMIPYNKHEYHARLNVELAEEFTSQTMMNLLTKLCPHTPAKLPLIMICNMITNQITKTPCPLQVVLGTLIREKELIQELYKCGIVCSYDEVLRFRKSAATVSKQVTSRGLVNTSQSGAGLVQFVIDNFDANISSQNGMRSTHSLAMLLTQTCETDENAKMPDTIPRLRKEEMTAQIESDLPFHSMMDPKKQKCHPRRRPSRFYP